MTKIIPRSLIEHLEWKPGRGESNSGDYQNAASNGRTKSGSGRRSNGGMKTKIAISVICIILGSAHLYWPDIKVDLATVVLLVVALLPWFSTVIRSVELPGVFKIELHDVKAATEKVTSGKAGPHASAHFTKQPGGGDIEFLREVASGNPNLALVGLRIEIERRLSQLATLAQMPTTRRSAGAFLRDLMSREEVDRQTAAGLSDLIALGNQAAHGAEVSPNAAAWALDVSPLILELLDSLIESKLKGGDVG